MGHEVGAPQSYCSEIEDSGRGLRRLSKDERVGRIRIVIEPAVGPEVNDRAHGDAGRRRRVGLCEGEFAVHQARQRCRPKRPIGYDVTRGVPDMRRGAGGHYQEDGCGQDDGVRDATPAVASARRSHRPPGLRGTLAPGVGERAPGASPALEVTPRRSES